MNQDPDPIEPDLTRSKITFAVNGNKMALDAKMIPKLFVAYVAAKRAEYYAGVDAARCDDSTSAKACFKETFRVELRHAMNDRSKIKDWMENNMDVADEKADEISVLHELKP